MREDLREHYSFFDFEEEIVQSLKLYESVALVGLPGTGKSSVASAVGALYKIGGDKEDDNPVVILTVDAERNALKELVRLVKLPGMKEAVAIPVIRVPRTSKDSELLLTQVLSSASSLSQKLEAFEHVVKKVALNKVSEGSAEFVDIQKGLKDLIEPEMLPARVAEVLKFAEVLEDAIPFARSILNAAKLILEYVGKKRRNEAVKEMESRRLLVILDNIEDLGPNWEILSDLLANDFRRLVVLGVESASEYIKMVEDPDNVRAYLRWKNFLEVNKVQFIPPPSSSVFSGILRSLGVSKEKDDIFWRYTGGFPAIAAVMADFGGERLNEEVIAAMENFMQEGTVVGWVKAISPTFDANDATARRLVKVVKVTRDLYDQMVGTNAVYAALFASPKGLLQEHLLLFCFCSSDSQKIYVRSGQLAERLNMLRDCKVCDEKGPFQVVRNDTFRQEGGCTAELEGKKIPKIYPNSMGETCYWLKEPFSHMKPMLNLIENLEKEIESMRDGIALSGKLQTARATLKSIDDCIQSRWPERHDRN